MKSAYLFVFVFVLFSFLVCVKAQIPPPSSTAGHDPLTSCSPLTISEFNIIISNSSNVNDTEGAFLGSITTNYPQQYYYETLSANAPGPGIFINVTMNPAATGFYFIISLNGVWKNTSGMITTYSNNPPVVAIEFPSGWISAPRGPSTNIIQLNVTQEIDAGPFDTTTCHYVDIITITNPQSQPGTGGNIVGDPQFVGLRGQEYQVHGVDGAVYNLISDQHLQLNTRFTFLEGPRPCPVMPSTGKLSTACWSHPGSYLSELALKTTSGDQLFIASGTAKQGFSSITFNDEVIPIGGQGILTFKSPDLHGWFYVNNTHEMSLSAGFFDLVIENNDGFVNLRSVSVSSENWNKLSSHGLLGQTWRNKRYAGKIKEIEGDVDDYLIDDDDLFGDSFLYNKFHA